MSKRITRAAVAVLVVAAASRAEAFPAFARKYGMSCTACHVAWPILNQEGTAFRDNGYTFGLGKDDPTTLPPSYIPIAIRTTPAYSYTRTTNQTADDGTSTGGTKPVTVSNGGVPVPGGVDILSGGSITPDISYLVVIAGFSPSDGLASVESAFVRFNRLGGSTWANVRLGKFELDQPASNHRNISLTYGYAAYGAHPEGSQVAFDMGENQVGVELDGHDDRSSLRYSLSLTSANGGEGASKSAWSSPLLYGHVQKAFETPSAFLPWIRIGALGAVGWWPTKFEFADTGQTEIIPGTGSEDKQYSRYGLELSGILGHPATPFFFTVAWIHGQEAAGLAGGAVPMVPDPASPSNSFDGYFLEVNWVPRSLPSENANPWLVFARFDAVRYKTGTGNTDGFTVGARRYLAVGPRASAAIHLEYHQDKVKGVGWVDANGEARAVETQAILAGVDFDF